MLSRIRQLPWLAISSGFGCLAVLGALIARLTIWSENSPANVEGLMIAASGTIIEIFLIVIVLERINFYREKRKRKILRDNIAMTIQRAFVDLMRINHLFEYPTGPDNIRIAEFLDISRFSLSDFRSQIEALSMFIESEEHARCRSIEKKMNFIHRNFHAINENKNLLSWESVKIFYENHLFLSEKKNWKVLTQLALEIEQFLIEENFERPQDEEAWIRQIFEADGGIKFGGPLSTTDFYSIRFSLQDQVLAAFSRPFVLLDASEEVNSLYFAIDAALLRRVATKS